MPLAVWRPFQRYIDHRCTESILELCAKNETHGKWNTLVITKNFQIKKICKSSRNSKTKVSNFKKLSEKSALKTDK